MALKQRARNALRPAGNVLTTAGVAAGAALVALALVPDAKKEFLPPPHGMKHNAYTEAFVKANVRPTMGQIAANGLAFRVKHKGKAPLMTNQDGTVSLYINPPAVPSERLSVTMGTTLDTATANPKDVVPNYNDVRSVSPTLVITNPNDPNQARVISGELAAPNEGLTRHDMSDWHGDYSDATIEPNGTMEWHKLYDSGGYVGEVDGVRAELLPGDGAANAAQLTEQLANKIIQDASLPDPAKTGSHR
jgi:hypothetical protein